ncbi:MAG: protease inhibitor I42 family protein [Sedimentisphaerales bacterium]|nr:protease inhibitor I42 family protein [Sedimentisphaerales bacterium]
MKKNTLSALILTALILMGCSNKQTNSDNGTGDSASIVKKVGESFVIKLESNRTTGYSWRLAELKSGIVEKVSDVYKPNETAGNIVGSGGIEEWTFKAVAKGTVTITLEYARPWEKDIPPVKTASCTVTVK